MSNEQLPEDFQPSNSDTLIDALPDLVVLVRRDGVVLNHGGGQRLPGLQLNRDSIGMRLHQLWPPPVTELMMQLTRRAIALRASTEAEFDDNGQRYVARINPHGPDRALCIIRLASAETPADTPDITGERLRPQLDRR